MGTAEKEEVGYGGDMAEEDGGSPASGPHEQTQGFPRAGPFALSIPSSPPGTLLTTLHFRMTLGMP